MTNREKFFEILNNMDNQKLSFAVNFSCTECPCSDFCKNDTSTTCAEALEKWLDETIII